MNTQSISCPSFLQAIYVPADDLTDPAPATTFAHLDATTVLSRGIAELGIYPAVDPLDSTSRMLDARIIGQEHYDIARQVQETLQASSRPSFHQSLFARGFCTSAKFTRLSSLGEIFQRSSLKVLK